LPSEDAGGHGSAVDDAYYPAVSEEEQSDESDTPIQSPKPIEVSKFFKRK